MVCSAEGGEAGDQQHKADELKSPNSSLRGSSRLRNKASVSAKAKQDTLKTQQDSGIYLTLPCLAFTTPSST